MMVPSPGSRQQGVTLVELLIALVIVGVLTAVALPLYDRYQARTYRAQATADIGDCAQALERFYTVNFTYAGANLATICTATSPPTGDALYNITLPTADASQFTLRAAPIAGTAVEGRGVLELDASGARRWDRDNSGTFEAAENSWEE